MRSTEVPPRAGATAPPTMLLFAGFFGVVLLLRFWALNQPPVWDGTGSVFPAASFLAGNGFDLGALLDQPGYVAGGPNVHALSTVTLMTAVAIRLLGESPLLFPVLHIVHLVLGALVGLGVYRMAHRVFGVRLALVLAVTSLVVPVVATQVGDIYLELPVLAAGVWAAVWWLEGRLPLAVLAASLAVTAKDSGLIVAAGLGVATWLTARRAGSSGRDAVWFFAVPGAIALLSRIVLIGSSSVSEQAFSFELVLTRLLTSIGFLVRVPDLLILLLVYLLVRPAISDRPIAAVEDPTEAARVESLCRSVLGAFGLFYLFTGGYNISLIPRYLALIVPFLLIGLALLFGRVAPQSRLEAGFAIALVVFAVNGTGWLYPAANTNSFAVVERSAEYRDLLALHQATSRAIAAVPDDIPVFYTVAEHYRVAYPVSGYVDEPVRNGVNVYRNEPFDAGRVEDYPDHFYVVVDHLGLGGRALYDVWQEVEADAGYTTAIQTFTSGEFTAMVIEIMKTS